MNDKPISVAINELKMDLAKCINDATLPPCIVEPILKDLYEEAHNAAIQQLMKEQKEYEEKQKENKETVNE